MTRYLLCLCAAGITQFVVGTVFHFLVPLIAPSIPPQYANTGLFRPWTGWTSTYMVLHPFGFGAVFAATYFVLLSVARIEAGWLSGLLYGLSVFLVGSLPVFLLVLASFRVSPEIIAAWIFQNGCQYLIAGFVVGTVSKS